MGRAPYASCLAFLFIGAGAIALPLSRASAMEVSLGTGMLVITSGTKNLDITAGFKYDLLSFLDVGADLTYLSTSYQDTSVSGLSAVIGPTLYLGPRADGFFITLGIAWRSMSGSPESATSSTTTTTTSTDTTEETSDPNGIGFAMLIGKKIPLFAPLSLRPTVGISMINGGFGILLIPAYLSYQF